MLNKTDSCVLIAAIAMLAGCTQTARSDYSSAGHKAASAVGDVGKAISADATATGHTIRDALGSKSKPDDRTAARVSQAILKATDIRTTRLRVTVEGNTAILRGTVETELQNQHAEHLARHTLGPGYTVDDQLVVDAGG